MNNKPTSDELFYKQFWKHPCDCGYYYAEERKDYWIYAKSKEIAKEVITEQRDIMFFFTILTALVLVFIPMFVFSYVCFCATGELVMVGFCLAFSIIALIGLLIIAIKTHVLRKRYKKEIIFLKKY